MTDDGLDIPEFLRIPAATRAAVWITHPPRPMPTFEAQREVVLMRIAEDKERTAVRISKMKAQQASKALQEEEDRASWRVKAPDGAFRMRPARYLRCLSEMPTPEHRATFVRLYGPPAGFTMPTVAPVPTSVCKPSKRTPPTRAKPAAKQKYVRAKRPVNAGGAHSNKKRRQVRVRS